MGSGVGKTRNGKTFNSTHNRPPQHVVFVYKYNTYTARSRVCWRSSLRVIVFARSSPPPLSQTVFPRRLAVSRIPENRPTGFNLKRVNSLFDYIVSTVITVFLPSARRRGVRGSCFVCPPKKKRRVSRVSRDFRRPHSNRRRVTVIW